MTRSCALVLALAALGIGSARAAPPTVTPSPGYDARLQEQRAAPASSEPAAPAAKRIAPRHRKRDRAR
ncbi:hypothetical protein [Bradyrhizobium genosp. P]|uniref:hypothetical protein n=1 Tax=Bradyrhizobium genosp. P TaxID=83641 RepID=UPI003CF39DD1